MQNSMNYLMQHENSFENSKSLIFKPYKDIKGVDLLQMEDQKEVEDIPASFGDYFKVKVTPPKSEESPIRQSLDMIVQQYKDKEDQISDWKKLSAKKELDT